jgi:hypothetical protein
MIMILYLYHGQYSYYNLIIIAKNNQGWSQGWSQKWSQK